VAVVMLCAGLVALLDQASKHFVMRWLRGEPPSRPRRPPGIRLVMNPGGSLGLARSRWALVAVWCAAAVGVAVSICHGQFVERQEALVGLGGALGGAAGNLVDKLRCGAIVDFIDLGFWPVFNLADAAIVLGASAALWFMR
jgi:signal peptidase II